jgi:LysM repeat protein
VAAVILLGAGFLLLRRVNESPAVAPGASESLPVATAVPLVSDAGAPAGADAGQEPAPSTTIYVVEPGDTLGSIAEQFDTSMSALIRANNLDDADLLSVGQQLVVPR